MKKTKLHLPVFSSIRRTILTTALMFGVGFAATAQEDCEPSSSISVRPITNIQIEDFEFTNTNAVDGYVDHSDQVATIMLGESFESSFQGVTGGSSAYFAIWIDWDQNGEFDYYERINYGILNSDDGIIQKTIEIPEDATAGLTKMRIAKGISSYPLYACGSVNLGQYVDISINILEEDEGTVEDCAAPSEVVAIEGEEQFGYPSALVSWTANGEEDMWEVVYNEDPNFDPELATPQQAFDNPELQIFFLEPGLTYYFYVRAVCSLGEDYSDWVAAEEFTMPEEPEFDCEDLGANFGDTCMDADGNEGVVTEDCDCFVEEAVLCDAPTDLAAVQFAVPSMATVSWNGDAGTYELAYGVSPFEPGDDPHTSIAANTYMISNLQAGTEYDIYVRSVCGDDVSDWASITYETAGLTCTAPTMVSVTDVTEDSATLSWNPGNQGDNKWEISLVTEGQDVEDGMMYVVEDDLTYTVTDLDPNTYYDVYIRTICSETNSSDWKLRADFTTEEEVIVCDAPTDLAAVQYVVPSMATVSWNGDAGTYELAYGVSPFEPGDGPHTSINTNTYMISNLQAGTEYDIYVRSVCGDDVSDWASITYETAGLTCTAPTMVSVSDVTEDSATLSWNPGNQGDNKWEISLVTEGQDVEDGMMYVVEDDLTYTVTDLDPNTYYDVYIRTICSETNSSDWKLRADFTTEEEQPEFDCEDLEANFGDICIDADGNEGVVTEDCDCFVEIIDECEVPFSEDNDIFISMIHIDGIGVDIDNDYYDLNYSSSAKSENGYAMIDSPEFTIYPNYNGSYAVSSGPAGNNNAYYYGVWIDFNGDGCFDEDEQVIWSEGAITNNQMADESVPASFSALAPGTYQVRIRNSMQGWPTAQGEGDGEALDFVLNIVSEDEAEHMLGIDNQVFNQFTFYPNPVQNSLNLKAGHSIEKVEMFNLLGQKVISVQPNLMETSIETTQLSAGVYMMNVVIDGSQKTYKIIKK